jgi:hypothetical protein
MAQPLEPATPFLHVGETDCVAGVVGFELRNPMGSKSARVVGGIYAALAKMAQQRRFALELRRCLLLGAMIKVTERRRQAVAAVLFRHVERRLHPAARLLQRSLAPDRPPPQCSPL